MRLLIVLSIALLDVANVCLAQQWPSRQIVEGESVTLKAHSTNALSFIWFHDGKPVEGVFEEKLVVNKAGMYTVIALNDGCESDISDPVEVIIDTTAPPKQIDMQIRKEVDGGTTLVGDEFDYQIYILNNSEHEATGIRVVDRLPNEVGYQRALLGHSGTVTYLADRHSVLWEPDNLAAGQSEELRIQVQAIEGGWVDNTAEVDAKQFDPDPSNNKALARKEIFLFKIPNVFTPNGDGLNDVFEIKGLELFPENEMMVYNRWGTQVFRSQNYKNDWNGQQLMEGTYYYIFRVKMRDNKWKVFKGPVAILYETRE